LNPVKLGAGPKTEEVYKIEMQQSLKITFGKELQDETISLSSRRAAIKFFEGFFLSSKNKNA